MSDSNDESDELSDSELARRLASHMAEDSCGSQGMPTAHVPEAVVEPVADQESSTSNVDIEEQVDDSSDGDEEADQKKIEFISTTSHCSAVCNKLQTNDTLAVDIEGVNLGRNGEICIIQLADKKGCTFLFDITTLGKDAFNHGLKNVLESEKVTKLFFDCRGDADALFHLYRVRPQNVLDMQVLCHKAKGGESMFVQGFVKALEHVLPYSQRQVMKGIKEAGQSLFAPDRGGNLQIWKKRPLPPILLKYCAQDVVHLFAMLREWRPALPQSTLRTISELRMKKRIDSKVVETGPKLARKDFEFPPELPKTPASIQERKELAQAKLAQAKAALEKRMAEKKSQPQVKPLTKLLKPSNKIVSSQRNSPQVKPLATVNATVGQGKAVSAQRSSLPARPIDATNAAKEQGVEPQVKRQRLVELKGFQ